MYGEQLPELPEGERLAGWWRELGCARSGLNGALPFEWQEVLAFAEINQYGITPVEARCLMDMSRAYSSEVVNSDPLRKPPMERDL